MIRDNDEMAGYESCCWCYSLRTGCIIVAVLDIFIQILLNAIFPGSTDLEVIQLNLVGLGIIGLLIYGIINEKLFYLWLWLAFNLIIVVFLLTLVTMCAIGFYGDTDNSPGSMDGEVLEMIIGGISGALATAKIAFASVVYSYACKLRGQPERQVLLPV